ncbi:DUF397 domain-containing protein [Streptomyces sp. NBC_00285]|uniref:DUF397 domain-containing protein n=1 Tax=Streptomyces sp. NBC_00285 TaxID=2975700 RepID=UPI002E2BD8EC|nr:DUF397 domain-containing protein [Streptomyces sp. NBC_00285]
MNTERVMGDRGQLKWRKSSYSGTGGGDCIEVATAPGTVHVRDSKDRQKPILSFSHEEWSAFVGYAKTGYEACI